MTRTGFHTQERRTEKLTAALKCIKKNAWLGEGYYFWLEVSDSHQWGRTHKNKTGKYSVYKALIDCEKVLDTVFNEEHYKFWLTEIEKIANDYLKKTQNREKISIKYLNQYLKEKGAWESLDGIMFQELPINEEHTKVRGFYYRKRTQIAVYNSDIISNFEHVEDRNCPKQYIK